MKNLIYSLILILVCSNNLFSQDGTLDATFINVGLGINNNNGSVYTITLQPDGKVIMGGLGFTTGGALPSDLVRLNANGSVDNTFNVVQSGTGVLCTAIQVDGKILAGRGNQVVRFNTNGSVDNSFNPPNFSGNSLIRAMVIQPDGKLLYGGDGNRIYRVNTNGTLDSVFYANMINNIITIYNIYSIVLQPNGKILVGGSLTLTYNNQLYSSLVRFNSNGSFDTTFSTVIGPISSLAIQPDGKILYREFGGNYGRLNQDGTSDVSFTGGSLGISGQGYSKIGLQSDGKILHWKLFSQPNQLKLIRLNIDGSLDNTFLGDTITEYTSTLSTNTGPGFLYTLAIQTDNKIIIGGNFGKYGGVVRRGITRINNSALPLAYLSCSPSSVFEGGTATFTTTLGGPSQSIISIPYIVSGTASNGIDYVLSTGSFNFPVGTTNSSITVNTSIDSLSEVSETLTLTLVSGNGYALSGSVSATLTIADNLCFNSTSNDTAIYYVSSANFQSVNQITYFEGTDSLLTLIGGCDSIVHHYSKYIFSAYHCTDTNYISIFDTVSIVVTDTLIINRNITGLNPITYENTIKLYPNPTSDILFIDFGSNFVSMNGFTLKIKNSLAQDIYTIPINTQLTNVSISAMPNGLYYVHLNDNLGNTIDIRKIVLQ